MFYLLLSFQTVLGAKRRLNMASHSWHWTSSGMSAVSNARPAVSSSQGSTLASECLSPSPSLGYLGLCILHGLSHCPLQHNPYHIHGSHTMATLPVTFYLQGFPCCVISHDALVVFTCGSFPSFHMPPTQSGFTPSLPTSIPPLLPSDCCFLHRLPAFIIIYNSMYVIIMCMF